MTDTRDKKGKNNLAAGKNPFAVPPAHLNSQFYDIPLIGEVHMSESPAEERSYNIAALVRNFRKEDRQTITLRAADDGMEKAGIYLGDLLTVNLNSAPVNHDIAAVRLGERIYIRRIFFQGEFVRLETDEENGSPYIVDPKVPGFEIVGKVVTVVREL